MEIGRTFIEAGEFLHFSDFRDERHEEWCFHLLVVIEPETAMAAIPREGEIAGAYVGACIF